MNLIRCGHLGVSTTRVLIRETRLLTVSESAKIQENTSSACKSCVVSQEFFLDRLLLPAIWRESRRSHSVEADFRTYTRLHTRDRRSW